MWYVSYNMKPFKNHLAISNDALLDYYMIILVSYLIFNSMAL